MDDDAIFAAVEPERILERIRRRGRKGMTLRMLVAEVVEEVGVGRSEARQLLREGLRRLEREGQVVVGRGKRYFVAEASELIPGVLRRRPDGGALVEVEEARQSPIQIGPRGLHGAMHGDRVLVRLETARRRARAEGHREGVVVRVLERALTEVVGRWVADRGRPCVRPLDRRLRFTVVPTSSRVEGEPEHGEYVVVSLESVTSRGNRARGVLLERLGRLGEPGVEERVILRLHGIIEEFAPDALAEARQLPAEISADDLADRWDLRDRPAITIDPVDARDFDDAVSASAGDGDAIVVEVHIADVGHFVRPGTALDGEARRRSTSVYLPGRCVPMLPERVSNELCTLRAGEDRLAYTARFAVADDGNIADVEVRPSVIRSRRRCTYGEVFGWLETPRDTWPSDCAEFADSLELLAEAADRLGRARRRRGSLDFDLAEPQVLLDPEGRTVAIEPRARNRAHRLIEELMVAANRCVATQLLEAGQPALHRVHDPPDPARVQELTLVLAEFGYVLDGDPRELRPSALQRILEQVDGRPEERLVATLVLRTMARALYSPEPRGHYALATDAYLHFTSPIRRYPDLVVHRMLRRLRQEEGPVEPPEREQLEQRLTLLGDACSSAEQRAEAAERMAVEWKTLIYLADRAGESFDGTVSGVTDFGLFVQLDDYFVDGMIHISELMDDYYSFDERRHRLVGERTRHSWRLGDRMRVYLVRVDMEEMRMELVPAGQEGESRARGRHKGSSRGKRKGARG
jgi:ribonuclease R